jgi:hypothetical protein
MLLRDAVAVCDAVRVACVSRSCFAASLLLCCLSVLHCDICSRSSVHCCAVSVLQGYGLGEASLQFEIQASLAYSGASSSSAPETLKLSPSVPMALSAGRTLGAKLLGDLAGYTQLPVLR